MILPVTVYGNPVLRKKGVEIDKNYEGLQELIENMFETMHTADGVGLAAHQIDRAIRLFIIDANPMAEDDPSLFGFKKVFINAEILEKEGEVWSFNEGCLSVPGIREDVNRPEKIHIQYYDENWEFHDEILDGVRARIVQHEYDHIEGIMFTDKIAPIRKRMLKGKLTAMGKGKVEAAYRLKSPKKRMA
ncbi:MAG: peptide deformylase [Bacteroidales bacterium]|nr:peptide deformylase [Bacteroidales bacterium]